MADHTLQDAFISELRDMLGAEKQLLKALPRLAKKASEPKLRAAFSAHLDETKGQIARLEKIFGALDVNARATRCAGMAGILEELDEVLSHGHDDATRDARLIAAAQRVEHYEMAVYGTLIAWGKVLGYPKVVSLLEQTLKQENGADKTLTGLAEDGINECAADGLRDLVD